MSSHELPARPTTVPMRALTELVALLPDVAVLGDIAALTVSGVTHDSRAVRPGDLYAALPGAHAHGADFAEAAAAAGAVAAYTDRAGIALSPALVLPDPRGQLGVVAAWVYGDPTAALDVIGVTGTNGKTTTAYLLEAGLAAAGRRPGLIGTVETRVGAAVSPSAHTTPEATDLQALFAVMREQGADSVAMEVSSHGLALGRVDGVRFAVAVFTNLSQDHLDFHGDLESYFSAKALLFSPERTAQAVVNIDDPYGARLAAMTAVPVVAVSAEGRAGATWRAEDVELAATGARFRVVGPGVERATTLRLPGAYNVANALGAVAALHAVGVDVDRALDGIAQLAGVPGRLEPVHAGQPFTALVDYAHTPESLRAVLAALRPLTEGRLVVVLGCGGDRDRAKRPLMGAAAAEGADVVVVTSDNPRSEDPLAIIAAVLDGTRDVSGVEVHVEPDRAAAIALACALAGAGDTVLVAGKGHEREQVFSDHVVPFDDRAVLADAVRRGTP